jgi:hypothetical protein
MEVRGHLHAPATFIPKERAPGTEWTEAEVDTKVGLKLAEERKKSLVSAGNRTPVVQSVSHRCSE